MAGSCLFFWRLALLAVSYLQSFHLKLPKAAGRDIPFKPGNDTLCITPNDIETADKISKMLGLAIQETEELTSAGQLQKRKEKEPLLSVDDLMNLGAIDERKGLIDEGNHMIVFIPKTRPVQVRALSWREYSDQTNKKKYPPPAKDKLEYSDGFTWAPPTETLDPYAAKASEKNEADKPTAHYEKNLGDDKADELLGGALDEW